MKTNYSVKKVLFSLLMFLCAVTSGFGQGDGTFENPYTIDDIKKKPGLSGKAWVKGKILGRVKNGPTVATDEAVTTNFALGEDGSKFIPVELPSKTAYRTFFGGKKAADLPCAGEYVLVYGNLASYFSTKGLKATEKVAGFYRIEIGAAGYATYYCPTVFQLPPTLQAGFPTAQSAGQLTFDWTTVTDATVINAENALVLKGAAQTHLLILPNSNTGEALAGNLLKGSLTDATLNTAGKVYYKLAMGDNGVGFYWDAENGASINTKANRAYLELDATASPAPAFAFNDITAIGQVKTQTAAAGVIYDLSGRIVAKAAEFDALPKGIYIVNGKKIVK